MTEDERVENQNKILNEVLAQPAENLTVGDIACVIKIIEPTYNQKFIDAGNLHLLEKIIKKSKNTIRLF